MKKEDIERDSENIVRSQMTGGKNIQKTKFRKENDKLVKR